MLTLLNVLKKTLGAHIKAFSGDVGSVHVENSLFDVTCSWEPGQDNSYCLGPVAIQNYDELCCRLFSVQGLSRFYLLFGEKNGELVVVDLNLRALPPYGFRPEYKKVQNLKPLTKLKNNLKNQMKK